MRVDPISYWKVLPSRKITATRPPEEQGLRRPKSACPKQSAARAKAKVLEKGGFLRELHRALQLVPEVRRERVEAVREKLASGQYKVDSRAIARRIAEAIENSQESYRAAA